MGMRIQQSGRRLCPPPPATKSWWGGYGWGAFGMRRKLCRPDAHAWRQGAANHNRYRGGAAPHPYPPHRFAGGGGQSALIASVAPPRVESGTAASIAGTWVCVSKRGADAGVPLPPRRSRGG